ncbi:MAG: hypothetical protein V1821_00645 [bacterium]
MKLSPGKILAAVYALLALAVVVWSFVIVGSPRKAREAELDSIKIQDLQRLEMQVNDFVFRKDRLPVSLSELLQENTYVAAEWGKGVPAEYEYRLSTGDAGRLTYELCANFLTSNVASSQASAPRSEPIPNYQAIWTHATGRACFNLEAFQRVK